ncbi:MAG TPA: Fe-S cluster assembly ATPase SufC, partial [Candidatus Babeliaceae bacterium]|nr:Fe-S cluster assembly ATPase SufC [Candidatus Babeliaceae bacterium]
MSYQAGTTHIIMGPNGSGKTSLALGLMGHPSYALSSGSITLNGKDITDLAIHKRAQAGFFLAFQQPYDIPGVSFFTFLQEAYRSMGGVASSEDLQVRVAQAFEFVGIAREYMFRPVNHGFSGGEKKRLELAQLLVLNPCVVILDEPDSGIDAEGIMMIARVIKAVKQKRPEAILIIITHNTQLAENLEPDAVHILVQGRLVSSSGKTLINSIGAQGYD